MATNVLQLFLFITLVQATNNSELSSTKNTEDNAFTESSTKLDALKKHPVIAVGDLVSPILTYAIKRF